MILKGKTARLYGNVQLGKNVILEDDVVIGHPSAAELQGCLSELEDYESLEALYQSKSINPTVIGDNVIIRSGTIIYSGVTIGNHFDCGHKVLIRENCHIGDFVYIKSDTHVMKGVHIGSSCRIAGLIGDFSTIQDGVNSLGSLVHVHAGIYTSEMSQALGPTLHEGVLVGRGAVVIGDVHIHEGAWIAANATVNFDVLAGSLVVGTKGQIRQRNKEKIEAK